MKKPIFEESFASFHDKEKIKCWSDKNELKPEEVFKHSNKLFIFNCDKCNHEFSKTLCKVSGKDNRWCPYCANQILCENKDCKICYNKTFQSVLDKKPFVIWHSDNKDKPINIFKSTPKKYFFYCDFCDIKYEKILADITKHENKCNFCVNCKFTRLCKNTDCDFCFNRSFASSKHVHNWSDQNKINPRDVLINIHEKYIFNCFECNHIFERDLKSLNDGHNLCPYCNIANYELCGKEDCKHCFSRSFADSDINILNSWSEKNELKPIQVSKGSNELYIFNCYICKHEIYKRPNTILKNGWCPYCCEPTQKLCDNLDCTHCFERSFTSHEKSIYFSEKNKISARSISKNSAIKYIFKCNFCYFDFNISPDKIIQGRWCSICKNKTEKKIFEYLKKEYNTIENQFKTDWCRKIDNNKYLPFDFVIKDFKIIIELDGDQHFKQVSNWKSPDLVFKNDIYKMICANKNGFSVIRITQDDVYKDKINWKIFLKESIEHIRLKQSVENHFISFDENIYFKHMSAISLEDVGPSVASKQN